jgi:hypothetical protein
MYKIGDMQHQQMVRLITSRLDRLSMCKRGVVETDINEQKKNLGNKPVYTPEERVVIQEGLAKKIQKAMTPTASMIKKHHSDTHYISQELAARGKKVLEGAFVHPGEAAWKNQLALIQKQHDERIATIDGDFQDIKDEFILGVKDISEFSKELLKLEQGVW